MIKLSRNTDRRHVQRGNHDTWLTFYPRERAGQLVDEFGVLVTINEVLLPPGGRTAHHPGDDEEIVTYMFMGALAHEDSNGGSGVIYAGEFQCMTTGRGIRHRETNPSRTEWAHLFQIAMRPSEAGLGCAHEQKRFAAARRRNVLCPVASPDGREGSLRMHQDALIYSSMLDPGHHIIHELLPWRSAWLHLVAGKATLHDIVLTQGDGVGVTIEPSVSLTAQEHTEILLVDLGSATRPSGSRVVT